MSDVPSKPVIPKFGSFKPKQPDNTKASEPSKEDLSRKSRPHEYRRRRRSRDSDEESIRDRSKRERDRQSERTPASASIIEADSAALAPYVIDRRGDPQNLVYGRLHRYDVPPFHRIGAGNVLGAKRHLKIDRETANEAEGIVLAVRSREIGHREKYAFSRNQKIGSKLLRILPEATVEGNITADFISFKTSKKRKRSSSDSENASDEPSEHYRSIEGKAKTDAHLADENLEYVSDTDTSGPESSRRVMKYDEALRQRSIEYSRAVDTTPHDFGAWMNLINHQDSLLGHSDQGRRKVTGAERRSTADIKIHLYEKAIQRAGSIFEVKESLLLGLMEEGSKIWDFKTLSKRWETIAAENLESLELWKRYLDFQQSFNSFSYEQVRENYQARIRVLGSAMVDEKRSFDSRKKLQTHLIYIVLRATLFMRESGFTELAVGVWQGLLEYNYFAPNEQVTSRLEHLQDFWEAEVPRIGEDTASGWKNYLANRDAGEAPPPRVDVQYDAVPAQDENFFGSWALSEVQRANDSLEPARTLDEVTEDDPYRVILWSDIEEYMIDFSQSLAMSPALDLLLSAFLLFCRQPPLSHGLDDPARVWWTDSFIRDGILERSKASLGDCYIGSSALENPSQVGWHMYEQASLSTAAQTFAASHETMFPSQDSSHYLVSWGDMYGSADASGPLRYKWVRNCLKKLKDANKVTGFTEYWLAFEACNEPESIKKIAKGLLKHNSSNVRLYNAYALIEAAQGNVDIARSVVQGAIGMCNSLPEQERHETFLLKKTWAWILIESLHNLSAFQSLLSGDPNTQTSTTSTDTPTATLLLKSKQHFLSASEFLCSSRHYLQALQATECLALLVYLSPDGEQHDIESALEVYTNFSKALISRNHEKSETQELLHQSIAKLLRYHMIKNRSYSPGLIREHLTNSLSLFPQNTILLSVYAFNERRLRIDDRVRSMLVRHVLTAENDCLSSRLFAINHELQSGNVHSIHAAFENAVTSPKCASNPGLWRIFVLFCKSRKEYESKARDIFYRGMRACPWSKSIMMVAFEELRELMTFKELRSLYQILGEKGLRLHVDLEEKLEEWDEARKPSSLRRG